MLYPLDRASASKTVGRFSRSGYIFRPPHFLPSSFLKIGWEIWNQQLQENAQRAISLAHVHTTQRLTVSDGWSVDRSVGRSVGWSIGRSVGRLTGRPAGHFFQRFLKGFCHYVPNCPTVCHMYPGSVPVALTLPNRLRFIPLCTRPRIVLATLTLVSNLFNHVPSLA